MSILDPSKNYFTIGCLLHGYEAVNYAFPIRIDKTQTVADLKDQIWSKKKELESVDPGSLVLWKVKIPIDRLESLDSHADISEYWGTQLISLQKLTDVFSGDDGPEPANNCLHIIVQTPTLVKNVIVIAMVHDERDLVSMPQTSKFLWQPTRNDFRLEVLWNEIGQHFRWDNGEYSHSINNFTLQATSDGVACMYMYMREDPDLIKIMGADYAPVTISLNIFRSPSPIERDFEY